MTAPVAVQADNGQYPTARIAVGSCAFQWEDQAILNRVAEAQPDLYLSLGDAIYADFDGKLVIPVTPESLRAEWDRLAATPAFENLVMNVPVMATWDNHDYGCHDCGADFLFKKESEQIFLDFWRVPADAEVRSHPGVYQSRILGPEGRRVQVILLDTRMFRDRQALAERPADVSGSLGKYAQHPDPAARLLGEPQWVWLETQLKKPAEIRLIASSTQIVADQKGMDEWGNYPLERKRLFDLIDETGVDGVVLLSGNVHFSELSRTHEGPYPLYDFTSSGLTHVNDKYPQAANDYRIGEPVVELNFGLIDIDWNADQGPVVTFRAINAAGAPLLNYSVAISELRSRL
jgi:alkaline phosphatase D